MSNTSIQVCTGEFTDDALGGVYSGTSYTMTICPDNPGDAISVEFIAFSLQTSPNPNNSDYLTVFDGDNTGANSLGSHTGNAIQNVTFTASVFNPTGCLTFQFTPNTGNTNNFPGWVGVLECTTPCASPTSAAQIVDPLPDNAEQVVGVCLNEEVTFSDNGSFPEFGYTLERYIWKFDDGSIDSTTGPIVSHSFSEPGEYIVTLSVEDNNGCQSLNIQPLQVLVSTVPVFNTDFDSDICLGTTANIDGTALQSVTWTALPPQVVGGEFALPDGPGFSFENSIEFDYFEEDQVLESCDDLLSITVNMEHSYLGDLNFSMTCPDGTTVILTEFPNGGGGTFLGIPIDNDLSDENGIGFDYGWSPSATNGTWGANAGFGVQTLPSGIYESDYDMCAFVGCPLNGSWTLTIIDNLPSDDGNIFEFGVNFNPTLFPDVTTFTPEYGLGIDSTFWNGPFITSASNDGNSIEVLPDAVGTYDYGFSATNNFGCTFDTTIAVNVTAIPQVFTGDDLFVCEDEQVFLTSTLDEENPPLCGADAGSYTYCYTNNDNSIFTYCPDNQGDGVSFMGISFTSGTLENIFFDAATFYDGPDIGSPVIASVAGDLTGQSFLATNPSGCITMQITSDGSVSCESGSFTPLEYTVGCEFGLLNYDFSWTPALNLSQSDVPSPEVIDPLPGTYTYSVGMHPPGFPECATTASVNLTVSEFLDPGQDSEELVCAEVDPLLLFDLLDGNPEAGGSWFNSNDNPVADIFDPQTDQAGTYTYRLDNGGCISESELEIGVNNISLEAIQDTTVCINGTASFNAIPVGDTNQNIEYFWSGTAGNFNGPELTFNPTSNPTLVELRAVYGNNCETQTQEALVEIYSPLNMTMMNGETVCREETVTLETLNPNGGLPPYEYNWLSDSGNELVGNAVDFTAFEETTWCLSLSDACETTPIEDCVTIELEPLINPDFMADLTEGCNPINVNFLGMVDDESLVSSVIWDFGDGVVSNDLNFANHTFFSPGDYDVSLSITSVQGCIFDTTFVDLISSWPNPDAEFSTNPQTAYLPDTHFEFINNSFGGGFSEWTFGPYGDSFETNPDFEFPVQDGGVFEVELVSINAFGCSDTVRKNVFIQEKFVLYVPNAFTPDGDGINDFFFVTGNDVNEDDYLLQIYDRWGLKVWESRNIDLPWDGSNNSDGYFVKEGVYVWRIETRSLSTLDKKEVMGHLTLLR